jgi:hypothetical protein
MVAKIAPGKSIRDCFYYNENKVKEGAATILAAENYPLEMGQLTEHYRLKMLEKLAALNTNTTVNSVHISLNFDPSEKLPADKLKEIAKVYMDNLGFGQQPYLIYEHRDAGHPHIHIVTTNIEMDGTAITLHRLVNRKSEPARKMIEQKYGLVRAEDQKASNQQLKTAYAAKVIYGRFESRRSMANVLSKVIKEYSYSSLEGLNAILGLYNIKADRGSEDSRIYKNNGLVYRILDDKSQPVGVPIKASSFFEKPTLKYLEARFGINQKDSGKFKAGVKNAIDLNLMKQKNITLKELMEALKKTGIEVVLRQNKDGLLYGITYVDHKNKCVFNGSELGKQYSANAILERCGHMSSVPLPTQQGLASESKYNNPATKSNGTLDSIKADEGVAARQVNNNENLLESLMQSENNYEYLPYELRKTRKKRKKKTNRL